VYLKNKISCGPVVKVGVSRGLMLKAANCHQKSFIAETRLVHFFSPQDQGKLKKKLETIALKLGAIVEQVR
jgi:hypothetical protein